jgi:hypothetical protein
MRKRTLIPLLIAVILLAALGTLMYLRTKAPPEAARLLPESDAIVYLRLKSIRSATHFDQAPVTRSPYFQHFIDATGIVPERDLDSVALALHRMPDPKGPNGPVAYSEVFVGRFDGVKLNQYLASIASSQETYASRIIYTIPVENRQLRIAQLDYDTIAASNMPTPEQIHSMLDRSRASALSIPGSSLLAARYRQVPLLSEAWGIGHIGLPFSEPGTDGSEPGNINFLGFQLPLRGDTDLVASLRYSGASHVLSGGGVQLRIEEIAPDPTAAERTASVLSTILNIIRGISAAQTQDQQPPSQAAAAMQSVLSSIDITHHEDRAILNANASFDQIKALASAHNPTADAASNPDSANLSPTAYTTSPQPAHSHP